MERNMMKLKNKTKITTITLVLMFTISSLIVAIPPAASQETQTTYPFLGAVPNPVGKGQPVLFHVGIFQQLSSAQMGWEDLSITIEKPDGGTDTISDIKTDSTGGTGRMYTPEEVGVYYCTAHFPEQVLVAGEKTTPTIPVGTVMLASDSETVELVVQEEAIQYYPGHNLPTEYWTRPIDAQLREWADLTGNWFSAGSSQQTVVGGNAEAPETAHILWTKEIYQGGIAGMEGVAEGAATDQMGPEWSFSHGDAYEGKWTSRLIINGILIYLHRSNDLPLYWTAVDVRTGEEMWKKVIMDNRSISGAFNLRWGGYNHHAVYSYFYVSIGSTWHFFDPYLGEWEFSIENVPSGTTLFDENGWLYRVSLNYDEGTGYVWSMVDFVEPFGEDSPSPGSWLPGGSFYGYRHRTLDAAAVDPDTQEPTEMTLRGYISDFTFDADQCPGGSRVVRATGFEDRVFGLQYGLEEINTWAISLEPGHEGEILFSETWDGPQWWDDGKVQFEFNTISLEDGAAVFWVHDTLQYYCFSTDTGEYMWGPTDGEYYMNYYGWTELGERPPLIWDGKLYSSGAGGVIYCYDLADGKVLWEVPVEDPYQEYLFANNWWQFFLWIVDGKLYSAHMEHSTIEPMPRGAPFTCLDAQTGEIIWQAEGLFRSTRWGGRGIIGDSVMVGFDTYDNRLYAVGKGASAVTIQCPQDTTTDLAISLRGTVMDVSPGCLSDTNLQIRFPNGVPVVSDASMSEWMLYVWKQFERPDATGVEVRLEAVDPDGTFISIGTTTSDSYGNYGFGWCPEKVGTYMIIATFAGTRGYYGSTQTAYVTVSEPMIVDCPDPCPEVGDFGERLDTQTMYILILIVLVIIAIIIAIYALMKCCKK
jgi:outer membrane protein assembly factor BamB